MSPADVSILLGLLAALALLAVLIVTLLWQGERRRSQTRIETLIAEHDLRLAEARKDSVDRSRSSLKGQIAEQMAPLLPGFRYAPADARFLGDPVDYVVFSGYTEIRDNRGPADALEVVLVEVKQGGSSLTAFQRAIARSIEEGRFRFEVLRVGENGSLGTESWRPRRAGGRG
ncbi:MAG TPA: Holliday junction resolvase-like protein [Spirochaetia bacterium]